MQYLVRRGWIRNTTSILITAGLLGGCLSEEGDDTSFNGVVTTDIELSGSVGDAPVIGADMQVMSSAGETLASFQSDNDAGYNVTIETRDSHYPLMIRATGGTDLVTGSAPDFDMIAVATAAGMGRVANVNPFSTITVALADQMPGGLTQNNVEDAQQIVSTALNSGLDGLAATGPMLTRVDETNIAEMVKAAETLAEHVRRTRDLLQGAGISSSGEQVVNAMASDLTDSVVDGVGGSASSPRIAAVSTIVAAQVLLESMANELHVNGADATAAMSDAISQVSPQTPTRTLDDLDVTAGMISKARIGLAAAYSVIEDPAIEQLHTIVSGFDAGQNATLVRVALPANYRTVLQTVLSQIAGADSATIDRVNAIARTNGDLNIANLAPSIQGTPATSVTEGVSYSFVPTASDVDGDVLTFSISNMPAWANFDTTTGALAGVPTASDVGSYPNIMISVSDGQASDSLPAFSITVNAVATNTAPQISGTPAGSVNEGQAYSFSPSATDADGDTLTFSISNLPSWANFDAGNGTLSGTPGTGDAGTYSNIVISVSDGQDSDSLPAFSIIVNTVATNAPPQISGTPASSVNEGQAYSFTPSASDADGDALTFSVSNLPSWASFDTANGGLSGTPDAGDVGTYSNIVISVSDGQASASLPAFAITVNAISLGSATLSWTAPTQNEDGTPLTDLAGYKLYWGTTPGSYPNSVTIDNPSVTTYLVENLAPGTYEFVATSFNASGVESRYSGAATKVIP